MPTNIDRTLRLMSKVENGARGARNALVELIRTMREAKDLSDDLAADGILVRDLLPKEGSDAD